MILCCGEALIDMLPRETTRGESAYAPYVGGAVCNTAIGLARQGAPVGLMTGLSDDLFGQQLKAALEHDGVDLQYSVMSSRPTPLAFVTLSDGHAEYAFFDHGSAVRELTPEEMPDLGSDIEALFFGGISMATEPCGEAMLGLAERHETRMAVMLDPNIRPDFIADERSYRERLSRFFAISDCIKISSEDLAWLMGEGDPISQGASLLDQGPALVLITLGSAGAVLISSSHALRLSAPAMTVVDTVGAGDAFNAGWLAALHRETRVSKSNIRHAAPDVLARALANAVATASITVGRAGASPPTGADIPEEMRAALVAQVEVEPLEAGI